MAPIRETMRDKATIYVPSTIAISQHMSKQVHTEFVEQTKRFLAELFGGVTAYTVQGAWLSDSGELIEEDITLVYTFVNNLTDEAEEAVIQYCEKLRIDMQQEAIAVEILKAGVLEFRLIY